jgi:CBS domain-containing protein
MQNDAKNLKDSKNAGSISVKDIMKKETAVCTPDMNIQNCAKLMLDNDCGEIPIVESEKSHKLIGVITDRDITCRVVAKGTDPRESYVKDYMTKNIYTVKENDNIDRCFQLMSEKQIRRLPVVDDNMNCIGIVSQAHIARYASEQKAGALAKSISRSHSSHKSTEHPSFTM